MATSATASTSKKPTTLSSDVSLNRLMNWPTIAGITARSAWGSTTRRITPNGARPMACAASTWPRGTAWSPPRTISAM